MSLVIDFEDETKGVEKDGKKVDNGIKENLNKIISYEILKFNNIDPSFMII
ncbi:6999_t:CDS:2 [Gigaspora rosea]|nr:6999_t:CDS:2 [Gigaspora rosea]